MDKKVAKWMEHMKDDPDLSEDEKFMYAKCLAATPDERWRMNQTFLRSLGLSTYSERKKRGFC